jgi:osmotically-inducible protein OsmY
VDPMIAILDNTRVNGGRTALLVAILVATACQRDSASSEPPTVTSAPKEPSQPGDDDIAEAIQRYLGEDRVLRGQDVHVSVTQGIAELTGSVTTLVAERRTSKLAGTMRGVRSVVSQVAVHAPARSDDQVKSDVTKALHDDLATKASAVGVVAANGVVTLAGTTDSWQERSLIGEVAGGVPGVRGVDNQVTFHYAMVRPEAEVAAEVNHRLATDLWLDADVLTATVKGQAVHLIGVVGSFDQKVRADSDAWVEGVNSVDDSGVLVDWVARDKQRLVSDFPLRSDAEVSHAIRDAFKYDPRLRTMQPEVFVRDGDATLVGMVDSASARLAAESDARSTIGVWQVRDEVLVQPAVKQPSDADIARAAAVALAGNTFLPDRAAIQVSVSSGKATLRGTVASGEERLDASTAVASVPGVTEVDDELRVRLAPVEVKSAIEARLFWDVMVPRERVNVAVAPDGVATLTGTVDSWSQIKAASDDALRAGAARVVDLLRLEGHPEFVPK